MWSPIVCYLATFWAHVWFQVRVCVQERCGVSDCHIEVRKKRALECPQSALTSASGLCFNPNGSLVDSRAAPGKAIATQVAMLGRRLVPANTICIASLFDCPSLMYTFYSGLTPSRVQVKAHMALVTALYHSSLCQPIYSNMTII